MQSALLGLSDELTEEAVAAMRQQHDAAMTAAADRRENRHDFHHCQYHIVPFAATTANITLNGHSFQPKSLNMHLLG